MSSMWQTAVPLAIVMLADTAAAVEMLLLTPLRKLKPLIFAHVADQILDPTSVGVAGFFMTWWAGVRVRVTATKQSSPGGPPDLGKDNCAIIMSNHLRMSDGFLIAAFIASRDRALSRACWVSWKGTLNNPHTAMMFSRGNPFIEHGEAAVKAVREAISSVGEGNEKEYNAVVFFPEGGLKSESGMAKSKEFAARMGLPCPERSLLPRPKTFEEAVAGLPNATIYDVTVAYSEEDMKQGLRFDAMLDFFKPNKERQYHLHVEKFAAKDAQKDPVRWLSERYVAKDKLLEEFERDGRFPGVEQKPGTLTLFPFVIPNVLKFVVFTYLFWKLFFFVLGLLFW
jgi:Acyltransferase C-terminus/Acyltransferase